MAATLGLISLLRQCPGPSTRAGTVAVTGFRLAIPAGWLSAHAPQWLVLNLANIALTARYSFLVLGLAFVATLVPAELVVARLAPAAPPGSVPAMPSGTADMTGAAPFAER